MLSFPHDLVIDILCRQPVKTLIRFKCISKPLYSLIDDPDFVKSHLNHSIQETNFSPRLIFSCDIMSFSYMDLVLQADLDLLDNVIELDHPFKDCEHPTAVIGSCNGLLALEKYDTGLALWNPSTKKHKMLPEVWSPIDSRMKFRYNCGFGYDVASDDYKLVRMRRYEETMRTEVFVYSLKANSWRKLADALYLFRCRPGTIAAVVGGALHWTCENGLIVAFDLKSENFVEVPRPDIMDMGHNYVEVLGGCLCMHCDNNGWLVDVWVMKEYGVKKSWTKLFSISREEEIFWVMKESEGKKSWTFLLSFSHEIEYFGAHDVIILAYSVTGNKVLFCVRDQFLLLGEQFYWYDLDKLRVEAIQIDDLPEHYWYAVTSMSSSLVSPSATEIGA